MQSELWSRLGLTPTEADIYRLLLKTGPVRSQVIIKELKLKRATAYKALYALSDLGLIHKDGQAKVMRFSPADPAALLEYSNSLLREQQQANADLKKLLPELQSLYRASTKPNPATKPQT